MLMSKVIRPGVIHVSRIEPTGIQHEWIKTARMSISEIWKRLKENKKLNQCALIVMIDLMIHTWKMCDDAFNDFYGAARLFENKHQKNEVFKRFRRWKQETSM
jgi:hypothetical protein